MGRKTSSKDSNANGLTCLLWLQNPKPFFLAAICRLAGPSGKDPNPLSSWINWSWISWISSRFMSIYSRRTSMTLCPLQNKNTTSLSSSNGSLVRPILVVQGP